MPQSGNVRTDPEEMYSFVTDDHVYQGRGVCAVSKTDESSPGVSAFIKDGGY